MKYYKVLDENGRSCNGGDLQWSLPSKNDDGTWTPGDWMPAIDGVLEPCVNGYHLCRPQDLIRRLGATIYEAEYRGEIVEDGDKVVVREARLLRKIETWTERTARLFAVWCAREALKLIDKPDPRSVEACIIAERYANGKATEFELAAARAAAWNAARDAVWCAARDAVWCAARDAAWSAAWNAAWSAAWNAAWSAAWSAARSAARDAAWASAGSAVWAAARAAARADVRAAQTRMLLEMIEED